MTPRKPSPPASGRTRQRTPLILVVDDYADNREMYSAYLRFQGLEVVEAANGTEALEHAFERRPDLVVMDLSLPGVDGWQATRLLKADARTKISRSSRSPGMRGGLHGARGEQARRFLTKPAAEDRCARSRMLDRGREDDHRRGDKRVGLQRSERRRRTAEQ